MSEDTYFYGGNGEEAFTTGMKLECYICGEPVMVKIDQAEVDSIMREEKVAQSTARAIAPAERIFFTGRECLAPSRRCKRGLRATPRPCSEGSLFIRRLL